MSRAATSRLKVNPPLGTLPVLQYCAPDQLQIDEAYQRSLEAGSSQSLIRRIAMHWDWGLCQPLFVARRDDGGLYVVDGQHRLAAARLRGDIWQLPCVVASFASSADEAASFVALNQQRRPLTKGQLFKAALAAGDAEALTIQAELDRAGLWIGSSPDLTIQKPGAIVCIAAVQNCIRVHGREVLAASLQVLSKAWPGEQLRYAGTVYPGIVGTVGDYRRPDERTIQKMAAMLATLPQAEWRRRIEAALGTDPTLTSRRVAAVHIVRLAWKRHLDGDAPAAEPAVVKLIVEHRPARSFEEQLAMVERGEATCSRKIPVRRPDPDRTLGGVTGEIM